MKNLRILAIALITITTFSSCSNDDNNGPVNEEEVITTVTATFTPVGGGTPIILKSQDLDGDSGPDAPVVTVSDNFTAGTVYNGTVTFLNELESPAGNITAEIGEEGADHQIFFQQNGLGSFVYTDEDANGKPIGLAFTYTAANVPATGNLIITLRHMPNKGDEGVANCIITNAGGGTDAQVTFPVVVE